jgi:hypothetical protein
VNAFADGSRKDRVRLRNMMLAALVLTDSFAFGILALAIAHSQRDTGKTANCGRRHVLPRRRCHRAVQPARLTAGERSGRQRLRAAGGPAAADPDRLGAGRPRGRTSFSSLVQARAARIIEPTQLPSLNLIFDLAKNPAGIVFAAVFGFSPALLVSRIDSLVATYKSAIKSTETYESRGRMR